MNMAGFARFYGYWLLEGVARHPVLLLLLPYIGGLVLGVPGFIGIVIMVSLRATGIKRSEGKRFIEGLLIVLMAGAGVLGGSDSMQKTSPVPGPEDGLVLLRGRVTDGPWPKRAFGKSGRLLFVRDEEGSDYRVTVEEGAMENIRAGDRIRIRGRLHSHGTALFVRSREGLITKPPRTSGKSLDGFVYQYRKILWERMYATLDRRSAGVAATMLLGIPGQIDSRTRDLFRKTGTAHLLAISGLHMGLIALLSTWCLARLGFDDRRRIWLLVPMLGLFCLITGCRIPVARAYLVCVFYLLLMRAHRQVDPLDPLFDACLVLLILDPNALRELSFQLSFAGYFAILVFLKIRHRPKKPPCAMDAEEKRESILSLRFLPEPLKTMHAIFMRLLKKACLLFGVSLASWLGTMPLTLYYFQVFVPLAPVINVLVFPLFLLSLTTTAIHTLALSLDLGGSVITQWPTEFTITLLRRALEWLSRMWPGAVDVPPVPLTMVFACYGLSAVALTMYFARGRRAGAITD